MWTRNCENKSQKCDIKSRNYLFLFFIQWRKWASIQTSLQTNQWYLDGFEWCGARLKTTRSERSRWHVEEDITRVTWTTSHISTQIKPSHPPYPPIHLLRSGEHLYPATHVSRYGRTPMISSLSMITFKHRLSQHRLMW